MKLPTSCLFLIDTHLTNFKLARNFCRLTPRREPTQPINKSSPKYVDALEAVAAIKSGKDSNCLIFNLAKDINSLSSVTRLMLANTFEI